MSKRKSDVAAEVLVLNQQEVAKSLGMCVETFRAKLWGLSDEGFPKKDELLGGWIKSGIIAWLERRTTLVVSSADTVDQRDLENWDDE